MGPHSFFWSNFSLWWTLKPLKLLLWLKMRLAPWKKVLWLQNFQGDMLSSRYLMQVVQSIIWPLIWSSWPKSLKSFKKWGRPYEDNGGMASKLSGGPIPIKIPNICCAIYEVLITQKFKKTKFFQQKIGCMTPKLLGGPFLIKIYNIKPLLAWAIKTTKVNTVAWIAAIRWKVRIVV